MLLQHLDLIAASKREKFIYILNLKKLNLEVCKSKTILLSFGGLEAMGSKFSMMHM